MMMNGTTSDFSQPPWMIMTLKIVLVFLKKKQKKKKSLISKL